MQRALPKPVFPTDRKSFFVGFDPSDDALREIDAFFRKSGKVIVGLTALDVLDEQLAKKLARKEGGAWMRSSKSESTS